jgi:hypothetical protein
MACKHISEVNFHKLDRNQGWIKGPLMWQRIPTTSASQGMVVYIDTSDYVRVIPALFQPTNNYTNIQVIQLISGAAMRQDITIDKECIIAVLLDRDII